MISVIIPTLHEGKELLKTLQHLSKTALTKEYEVLLVDASDNPALKKTIKDHATLYNSQKGRAKQMNLGAKKAKGDIFLFLHADTLLPKAWDALIVRQINKGFVGGAFQKQFDDNSFLLSLNALFTNLRASLFHSFLGDNALFVKKSVFTALQGFTDIPIMEDVEFSQRLKKYKVMVIPKKVITSARRFLHHGIFKTIALMQWIRFLYMIGISPKKIKRLYGDNGSDALCIFAKYPEKGKVKTRLAKDLGNEKAVILYTTLLKNTINEHKNQKYNLIIGFTPKEKKAAFQKQFGNLNYLAQEGNDLGKRMHHTLTLLLQTHEKAAIVGSDVPNLDKKTAEKAFSLLDKHDIVLGPSHDGGYYLVAMKHPYAIFSNIAWSTSSVLKHTLAIIKQKKLSYALLGEKRDIDTVTDLQHYQERVL